MAAHLTNNETIVLYDGAGWESGITAVQTNNGYEVYATKGKEQHLLFRCDDMRVTSPPCYLVKIDDMWYIYDLERVWEEMPFREYRQIGDKLPNTCLIKDGSEWRMVAVSNGEIKVSKHKFAYFERVIPPENEPRFLGDYGHYAWFLISDNPEKKKFGVYFVEWLIGGEDKYDELIEQIIYDYVAVDFNRWKLVCYAKDQNITDVFDMGEGIKMDSQILEIYDEKTGELLVRRLHNELAGLI